MTALQSVQLVGGAIGLIGGLYLYGYTFSNSAKISTNDGTLFIGAACGLILMGGANMLMGMGLP